MRADVRTAVSVLVSMALATGTLLPLTADRGFVVLSWLAVAVACAIGVMLRRLGSGAAVVVAAQLLAVGLGSVLLAVLISGEPGVLQRYPALWAEGVRHMQTQSSPMEPNGGVTLIFVTAIALVGVVTDVLVAGVGRPAWAIAPLGTLFAVPAVGLDLDTGLVSFAALALGYLAVLLADGLNRAASWTRGLSSDSSIQSAALGRRGDELGAGAPATRTGPVVWRAAGLLAGPALVATVVLGALVPTISLSGLGWGNGSGGNGPLQLTDPSLDLKRNLTQPDDRVVFRYTTDQSGGVYLRMAALPKFSSAGFGNTQIRLNPGEELSSVPGYAGPTPAVRNTRITVDNFASQYLPLPYAPRRFAADGDWSYNANSLVVVNRENRTDVLRRLTYDVQSWDIAPTAKQLDNSGSAAPADVQVSGEVPADLPDRLKELSLQVTRGARTPAAKAAAIQAYLRDQNRFTYDTTRLPGSGYQALVNFLTVDKRGYCEQFATAMAMMARVNGIPSRVAVGFLPGQRVGDTWEVSIREMHSWPELYFANYGWVRFEPTPAVQTGLAPPWSVRTSTAPSTAPTTEPSADQSSRAPSEAAVPSPSAGQAPTGPATGAGTFSLRDVLLGAGTVLVLLLLAAPATIRIRRRHRRLEAVDEPDVQVEAAWAEIRDTMLDLGLSWPEGTPARVGAEVGRGLDPVDSEAMGRVATLVERARYARAVELDAATRALPDTTREIRRAIAQPAGWPARARAAVMPRSLFRRRRED